MASFPVCIILPMYNEERSFAAVRRMFDAGLKLPPGCDFHIIVVNDGSHDQTLELALQWARENPMVSVLSHTENMGLGQAILTGLSEAVRSGAACAVTMDADASHPSEIIAGLVGAVLDGADIAIASRFAPGGGQVGVAWHRRAYSLGARLVLPLAFPLRGVRDYTTSFRAYRVSLLKNAFSSKQNGLFLYFRSFTASAEILLKLASLAERITEVPLVLRYDQKKSPSKLKLGATIRDYIRLCSLPKQKCALGKGLRISE